MLALLSIVSALILSSCSSAPEENQAQSQVISSPTTSPTKNFHPISLDALSEQEFIGTDLKLEKVLGENSNFTRHYITYKSNGLLI